MTYRSEQFSELVPLGLGQFRRYCQGSLDPLIHGGIVVVGLLARQVGVEVFGANPVSVTADPKGTKFAPSDEAIDGIDTFKAKCCLGFACGERGTALR